MFTAQTVYAMLENESLWQTAAHCHRLLAAAKIPHAILGGVAVCLHGYQRNTVDVDVLIRREDSAAVRESLEAELFVWNAKEKEFRAFRRGSSSNSCWSANGRSKNSEVTLPDPADDNVTTQIEELPALTLPRLIETKIACGLGISYAVYATRSSRTSSN